MKEKKRERAGAKFSMSITSERIVEQSLESYSDLLENSLSLSV